MDIEAQIVDLGLGAPAISGGAAAEAHNLAVT